MEKPHIYQKIVATIRQDIAQGIVKPGDRLPPVRQQMLKWECTAGTVHRAYRELANQGLVISHSGQGTRVVKESNRQNEIPLRRAELVNRVEKFLLESMTNGYTPEEVEIALFLALSRWRLLQQEPANRVDGEIRIGGSHDMILDWLSSHLQLISFSTPLHIQYSSCLGGLIELAEGRTDMAGIHLWDEDTGTYNTPYVRRLLPGRRVALFTLSYRNLGLILPPGNPLGIHGLADLTRPGLRFVNLQTNSGSRIWMDAQLRRSGIDPQQISTYECEFATHNQVAQVIAEGRADAGLGIEASARAYGLDFLCLTKERYDLAIPEDKFNQPTIQYVLDWLRQPAAVERIKQLSGYDISRTGSVEWTG